MLRKALAVGPRNWTLRLIEYDYKVTSLPKNAKGQKSSWKQQAAGQSTSSEAVLRFRHTPQQWPATGKQHWSPLCQFQTHKSCCLERHGVQKTGSFMSCFITETQTSLGVGQLCLCSFLKECPHRPWFSQLSVSSARYIISFIYIYDIWYNLLSHGLESQKLINWHKVPL